MQTNKLLLVLSAHVYSDKAIEYAVKRAHEEGLVLLAFFLLDSELAEDASERFSDIGFTGDKPAATLSESLMRDYRQRGYEALGRAQIKAMEAGVAFEPLLDEGPYVATILEAITTNKVGFTVIQKRKERSLLHYFKKDLGEKVKEVASCEVIVIE